MVTYWGQGHSWFIYLDCWKQTIVFVFIRQGQGCWDYQICIILSRMGENKIPAQGQYVLLDIVVWFSKQHNRDQILAYKPWEIMVFKEWSSLMLGNLAWMYVKQQCWDKVTVFQACVVYCSHWTWCWFDIVVTLWLWNLFTEDSLTVC